ERLQLLGRVEAAVRATKGIDAVTSALTFAPTVSQGGVAGFQPLQRIQMTATDRRLRERLEDFVALGYLSLAETAENKSTGEQWWRISGRVAASKRHDYQEVLADAKRRVASVLASQEDFPRASAMFSGVLPLVQKAQEQMLLDLINSFASAFLVIAIAVVAMMLGLSLPDLRAASSAKQ